MEKQMSDFHFSLMSLGYKFRDLFLPRKNILKEVGIKPGFHVLDYGCGPGSYVVAVVELVGKSGKIYALDINPLAIQRVQEITAKKGLTNIETIHSDCATGLPDDSIDVVFLYDVLHDLGEPSAVLGELHRVLKPNGILSCSDHHMKEHDIVAQVTERELFRFLRRGKRTYTFVKEKP